MQFIDEALIDEVAIKLGTSEELRKQTVQRLEKEQPVLLGFLFSENFEAFLPREREYILFLILVIVESIREGGGKPLPRITEEDLSLAEEKNWEMLQAVTARRFRERLDVFFKDSKQEDLLAFIEDALIDEEEGLLSKEGREPIFVVLKSIIDAIHQEK
jgi:hypothetical protein